MLFGGALAAPGFAARRAGALALLAVGMVGTIGNLVGLVARRTGQAPWVAGPLVDRFGRYLLIRPHEVDQAHDWFERHGDAAVFFSRVAAGDPHLHLRCRPGVVRMPFWRFTALHACSDALPWTFALAWLGYELGDRWETVEHALQPFSWAIAGLCVVAAVWYVRRRWTKVRAEYAALDAAKADRAHPRP